ncbi:hypothetical protein JXB28_06425 [Candidatus Woesearchaeota archaeon]|nr:hypothetical protein [Candidatus Woesearchaeota archaeon]
MEISKKLFGVLVLAIFLVSAVPLAMARYGDSGGSSQSSMTGNVVTASAGSVTSKGSGSDDSAELEDDSGDDSVDDSADDSGNDELYIGANRFANVDDCVSAYKQRYPNADEDRIKNACEYAFKVKEALAPKLAEALPRVQRFMVQNQEQVQAWLEKLDERSSEMIQKLDRARLKECLEDTESCKEEMKQWKINVEKVGERIRERVIEKSKLLEANNKFLRANNQYLEAKNLQLRARNEFLRLKEHLEQCEEDGGDNCTEIEEQLLEKGKEDLIALADRLIQHLEKIKSKVEAAENLDEADAEAMIENIDEYISQLEDAKDDVDAADTKEELKEAAQAISDLWNDMEYYAKRYAERVIHAYTRGVFVRSELLEGKLEDMLARLEEKGISTSELEDLLDDFSEHIDEARDKIKESSDLFNEAKELRATGDYEEAKEKLEQAKELNREAHDALKEAHKILMELVREINESGESCDLDEIDEDDEVEMVECDDSDDIDED